MKLRTTAFALALTMALGLLSSCGSKGEPQQEPTPVPDPSISAPAEPDTPQLPMPEVGVPQEQPAPTPEGQGSLTLDKSDFTLFKAGDSYTLKAQVTGVEGALIWMSDNDTVATVAEDGTVTAVAPGTATITVTVGNLSAACVVRCSFEEDIPASGDADATPDTSAPSTGVDLAAFYESIMASAGENAPFMMELDSEMAQMIYPGIEAVELKQQALYMPGMSAVACEISMVECADAADVETVKSIFQTRIDTQIDGGAWYPETIEGWKNNSKIVVKGNCVALFVIPEGMMDAATEFEKLF